MEHSSITELKKNKQNIFELMNKPEEKNTGDIPLHEFSEEWMEHVLRLSMLSTLKGIGFEIHQPTPDLDAIEKFLRIRFNYWIDDIEHKSIGF